MKLALLVSLLGLAVCGQAAQRKNKQQPQAKAQIPDFLKTDYFKLPADLEISIWAHSPQLMNPTNMDIDSKGRIWVTEGMNYRRSKLRPAGDRIVVLTDSNGDGKADKSQTFYQGKELSTPLGIAVIGNEIYVAVPPNIIKFTDVDGNGIFTPGKDKKEVFLSGFPNINHDHNLHSLTAGPDGDFYFNVGNAARWKVIGKDGRRMERDKKSSDGHVYVQGAAFRIRPDGTKLQVIGHNLRNSYEQVVTSTGDVFNNDNDDTESCRTSWLMRYGNAGFTSADGKRSWRADKRPGQPTPLAHWHQADPGVMPHGDIYGTGAPTGIAFYENGALPKKYRGLLISAEAARN
ncbi:MAG: hypothetical protein HRT88_14015, partial [Lentisphaeraceae bacterium]|nr:hypothetical protein [Lentisphaeraceae bacterium]